VLFFLFLNWRSLDGRALKGCRIPRIMQSAVSRCLIKLVLFRFFPSPFGTFPAGARGPLRLLPLLGDPFPFVKDPCFFSFHLAPGGIMELAKQWTPHYVVPMLRLLVVGAKLFPPPYFERTSFLALCRGLWFFSYHTFRDRDPLFFFLVRHRRFLILAPLLPSSALFRTDGGVLPPMAWSFHDSTVGKEGCFPTPDFLPTCSQAVATRCTLNEQNCDICFFLPFPPRRRFHYPQAFFCEITATNMHRSIFPSYTVSLRIPIITLSPRPTIPLLAFFAPPVG